MRKAITLVWVLVISLVLSANLGYAQDIYTPDHPEVQKMAEQAAKLLSTYNENSAVSQHGPGEQVLVALTILEVSKRYENEIPVDHPVIDKAVRLIQETVNGGGTQTLEKTHSMYYGALSTVLLCEVDDEEYAPEIRKLIKWITDRQNENGGWGYENQPFICDTSQSQYACLALFVAKHHGFKIDTQTGRRALNYLTNFQTPNGSWYYHYTLAGTARTRTDETLSLHCSGLSTVYLLTDLLQLNPRTTSLLASGQSGTLPPSVSVYVSTKPGDSDSTKEGPLVQFDRSKLTATKANGNRWFARNFALSVADWNYYYLYALERYAFFRELLEQEVAEVPNWYDQGVDYLKGKQATNGAFESSSKENTWVATSLATLFLVRSSEILIQPVRTGDLSVVMIPETGPLRMDGGDFVPKVEIKGVSELLALLEESSDENARAILAATKDAVANFGNDMSHQQRLALLTGMVKERRYLKRLIAVKVLANEQEMDNVPALLYALGDPNLEIARHAHDGLRLISRRFDAFPLPRNASYSDFQVVKQRWTEWFLAIRPDAELID